MNEVTELQKKRAVNSIWNAARDYSFQPDFKAYDAEGQAELYLNCIIGALRRHYDYAAIEGVFAAFSQEEDADTYEGLFWLGLENCTFQREVVERPVLAALREDYARRFVQSFGGSVPDDYRLLDWSPTTTGCWTVSPTPTICGCWGRSRTSAATTRPCWTSWNSPRS